MSENPQYDESRLEVMVGLILLSLDSVASRIETLGVSFLRPDVVKQAARSVLEWLKQFPDATQTADAMIRHVREALECDGDPEDAKRTAAWLNRMVSLRKCWALESHWGPVLLMFNPEYGALLRQMGMREESVALLAELSEAWGMRLDELESLNESLAQSFESDWDRAQLREYQRESDLVSPIDFLSGWLHEESFLAIMRRIANQLSAEELNLFESWGQAAGSVPPRRISESSLSLENLNELLSSCPDE